MDWTSPHLNPIIFKWCLSGQDRVKTFEDDVRFNQEPVKLLQDGSDVITVGGLGNETGSWVLNHL